MADKKRKSAAFDLESLENVFETEPADYKSAWLAIKNQVREMNKRARVKLPLVNIGSLKRSQIMLINLIACALIPYVS